MGSFLTANIVSQRETERDPSMPIQKFFHPECRQLLQDWHIHDAAALDG
jgi:hypothetical protein